MEVITRDFVLGIYVVMKSELHYSTKRIEEKKMIL